MNLLSQSASSGHVDPEGEVPWCMQLVVRLDRAAPPGHTAVCEAGALAVVRLVSDERCEPGGSWSAPVARWLAGRIRKHARRAKGAAWERAQELPGVTTSHADAQVRALVPTPLDAVPREIAKLQMQGLDLADHPAARPQAIDAEPNGPVVVSITPEPVLSTGKAAAAAGHAAQIAWMEMAGDRRAMWVASGLAVQVEHPALQRWRSLRSRAQVTVTDAGLTDVDPGTVTALARWA
ncbi:peptidyl-tRNA hydrolase [Micromonospora sp. NPDC000442]|uniref:peptidyl-tRNA hydrolase n=1 Tax=Micromonospora sp. NPDC000442 TaxID=3364217 RepID=UPI0036C6FF3B